MRALPPALLALLLLAAAIAQALPVPQASDGIGPGSRIASYVDGQLLTTCSSNWVWRDAVDGRLFLGTAGHCVLPAGAVATHGAGASYDPSRTRVDVCIDACDWGGYAGGQLPGTHATLGALAYARQGDAGVDFALVEIPTALHEHVRAGMTSFGAPTHVAEVRRGATVCMQGASIAFGEHHATQSRVGLGHGNDGGRWWAAYAGAYGDSGAALATCVATAEGLRAVAASGIVTQISPYPDRPGIAGTTMARAVDLAWDAHIAIEPLLG